jgi:(S)-ureidoglycine aminohydrolase
MNGINMKNFNIHFVLAITFTILIGTSLAQTDSVISNVYKWDRLQLDRSNILGQKEILNGYTTDLESLIVYAGNLPLNNSISRNTNSGNSEEMIIIKEGEVIASINKESKLLGPGSILLIMPGDSYTLTNTQSTTANYYIFKYRSKISTDIERGKNAGGSMFVNWEDVEFNKTEIGGRRQNFDRATAMFDRFELHTSTLNEGLTNHKAHTHRAEEFVLVIKGEVQMLIGDKYYKAGKGDLIFLESNIPHSLDNVGKGPTEYFAFQWQLVESK